MSLPPSATPNQAIRCDERNHRASIARQRKAAGNVTPHEQAEAIGAIVRKCIADGRPVPDLDRYGLTDAVWTELLDILDADELSAIGEACGGDDLEARESEPTADDITRAFEDDVPLIPEPPAPKQAPHEAHAPSWRDHEPKYVHSMRHKDASGIEHMTVIRADDLDELLLEVRKFKAIIDAAKARDAKAAAATAQTPKEPGSISPRRCEIHDAEMTRRVSKKTGKLYSAHEGHRASASVKPSHKPRTGLSESAPSRI